MGTYEDYIKILKELNYSYQEKSNKEKPQKFTIEVELFKSKLILSFSHAGLSKTNVYINEDIPIFILKKSLKLYNTIEFQSKNELKLEIKPAKNRELQKKKLEKTISYFIKFYENLLITYEEYTEDPRAWVAKNCPERLEPPNYIFNNSTHILINSQNYTSFTNLTPPMNFVEFEILVIKAVKNQYMLKLIIKNSETPDFFFVNTYKLALVTDDIIKELVYDIESKLVNGTLPDQLQKLNIGSGMINKI